MQHGEGLKQLGVHLARGELVHLLLIVVDTLAAGRDLEAAEKQVERQRELGILRVVHRVERALGGREVGDEHEIAAVLLLCPLAEQHFFVRVEVVTVLGLVAVLLFHDLLGLVEADGRDLLDLRDLHVQHGDLFRAVLLDVVHHILQHAGLHLHDVVHRVDIRHLEVEADIFVQMARGVVALGAVNRADLKHAAERAREVLLVELRGLRKVGRIAEVVQLEQVRAALCARDNDLGRVDVGKALRLHIFRKAVRNRALNAEYRLLARMAQGDRAQRQVDVERQAHILLAERHGELLVGAAEYLDRRQDDLHTVLGAGLLVYLAGHLEHHCVLDLAARDAADLVALEGALDQAALDAHNDKREVRHVAHAVHGAAEGDVLADRAAHALYGIDIPARFMNHFHNLLTPLYISIFTGIYCIMKAEDKQGFLRESTKKRRLFHAFVRRHGAFSLFERLPGAVQEGADLSDPGRERVGRGGGKARFAAHFAIEQGQGACDRFQFAAGEREVHRARICPRRRLEQDCGIAQAAVGGVVGFTGAGGARAEPRADLDEGQVLLAQQINLPLAFCQDG